MVLRKRTRKVPVLSDETEWNWRVVTPQATKCKPPIPYGYNFTACCCKDTGNKGTDGSYDECPQGTSVQRS